MRLLFDEVCGQGVVYLKERFTKLAKPFENLTCIAGRTGIRRRRGGLGMIALCRPGKCHTLFCPDGYDSLAAGWHAFTRRSRG